jgi:hypothetical protein
MINRCPTLLVRRLSGDLLWSRNVRGRFRRADIENWGTPLFAFTSHLTVFRCLGRDPTLEMNVWKDGCLLCIGDVDLDVNL